MCGIVGKLNIILPLRRGDYVSNPETRRVHGVCNLDYYRQCISLITERITNPLFFVFSDDPGWIIEKLRLDYPTTFVIHNDAARNYEDLRLMSLCRHHIIANSSFSWWGAWLCTCPGKIVMAPKRWFKELSRDTRDLLPESWQRI